MSLLFLFSVSFAAYVSPVSASWSATYPDNLWANKDSCAVLPCTFAFPSSVSVTNGIMAIWFKEEDTQQITVFHSKSPETANARFRNRAELLGDPLEGNCTLVLRHLTKEDSGQYSFRFEVVKANSWTEKKQLQLTITDNPDSPTIAVPGDLREGVPATFKCSSPYVCPYDHSSLRWFGYDPETSHVSGTVQLDTTAAVSKQTLQTTLTWKNHQQKLACEASVGTRKARGEVTLLVGHAPKGLHVALEPPAQNIRVGDAVTLICNVNSSYPEPTAFRWFKDGTACGTERVKTIRRASLKDYGRYHCEAENSLGSGVAEGLALPIFAAVLSVSPSSSIREGEPVTLTCEIPGEDQQEIHYSWFKNNIWFKEGAARILTFQEVTVGDTGYYTCKVQNDKGSETSSAIGLTVFYPPRSPSLALFQETQRGQLAIVHCTVESNPQSTLSLFRDQRLLATTSSHSAPNQRISIAATRNSLKLEIQKVTPEDEGEYQCVATNKYGNATTSSFFRSQTARVVASPSGKLVEGQRVTLTCVTTVGSEEDTTYTWYKNAKWVEQGQKDSLVLSALVREDAGTFHCVAENKKGSHLSPPIALRVLYSPRLPAMTSFLETQGGHLGIIQCTVDSDPPSEIAFYKGDTLVGSNHLLPLATDPRIRVTSSPNALKVTIQELRLDDEGEYVCSAQNRYGDAMATMDFTAETASIAIAPSPEIHEGDPVRLLCVLSGNLSASANYSWFKEGLRLPGVSGDSLVLEHATVEDAGAYKCRVEYPGASKTSSSASLSVLFAPRNLQVSVFTESERGTVAIFQCSVDSNPPATWALYKGDTVLATSKTKDNPASHRISVTTGPNAMRVEMTRVGPEDEGSYNVTATNAHGATSRQLYFRVQTARILISPSPEVLEGEQVRLTCDLMGGLPEDPSFSWYRNSKHLQGITDGSLTFLSVTHQDAGAYYCKAQTADGKDLSLSPSISLTVFYPPRKPHLTAFLETPGSRVAVLQCTVESDPQAHLALRKGRQLLASSTDSILAHRLKVSPAYNSLRVEIWDVVMEDEGEYACWASNRYGNGSASITFRARAAKLWISPPDALEGNSVNLTCAVDSEAVGDMRYTWFKNNEWYAEGLVRTLVLHQATIEDAGTYYCTAQTRERMCNSSLSTLDVLYPPRNVLVKSFLEIQKGQLAIILCTVESNPPSVLSLRRADQVLASSSSKVRGVPGQKLRAASSPNSLRLEIRDVNLKDEGSYECWASNSLGRAQASFNLSVETLRLVIEPIPEVHEGQRVSLVCEDANFQPSALYTWYKDARWLGEGPATSFLLRAVTSRDMGSYSCQAQDERGIRTSPPVALYVHYEPKKVTLTSFLESPSGHQAILQCAVESYPPAELTLHRGNVLVAASSRLSGNLPAQRYVVHASHNVLKVAIQKVLQEDEGQYRCLAKNAYGTSKASIHFTVPRARITIDPSPDVHEGSPANLTCEIASRVVESMNYTWYKDSRWLWESPDGSLLLSRVTRDDTGAYHCQATGRTGSLTSAFVHLKVQYAPDRPSLNAYLEVQNGKLAIITCQVESYPPSRLAVYKGGQLLAVTKSFSPAGQRFHTFYSHNRLRLEIQDITETDSGDFVCQADNALGNATSSITFDAGLLSKLTVFEILAGIAIGVVCIAALAGLVFGVQTNGSRIYQKWITWTKKKSNKEEVQQDGNREETIQLNGESPDTPPAGMFCFSYRRLPWRAGAVPKVAVSESSCTSTL
ncbi:sialoadhesin [Ahaetulla prasina]|uniref:sialoadhesin n=1 Tax=Ahaetulla prasina TaxID=499056 RepID=UPI0026483ECF|nr:sialoadhesin [Ahaetulla prasina]XP_058049758.1 sialoadhesin [Ahaetulla prasina]XP_058049759.1 sialoadhesin [Ahaetulla prasina]XP_058049760.1 sialoadhesin [Ahaetulla prasina]